jgi:hypothetical protein
MRTQVQPAPTVEGPEIEVIRPKPAAPTGDAIGEARLRELQENAHRPEIQEVIRREIVKGTIRTIPAADGSLKIVAATPPPTPPPAEVEPADVLTDRAPRKARAKMFIHSRKRQP